MSATVNHLESKSTHVPGESARGRLFFLIIACLLAALVFVGFAPTFYLHRYFSNPVLPTLLFVHGLVFSLWPTMLVAQSALARLGRRDLHKRLGIAGACLAAIMVPLGIWVAIEGAAHGTSGARLNVPPLQFLIVPLGQIVIFGGLTTAALLLRRNPAVHKRLILIATINLIAPALARITSDLFHITNPIAIFVGVALLIAACFVFDFVTSRRIHPAFVIAGLASLLSFPLRIAASHTQAWLTFANWLTQ